MGKRDEATTDAPAGREWPPWARRAISAVLVFHLMALLVGVLGGAPPFSIVERQTYEKFKPYYDLIDQGWAYNYYAPEPPPTPVIEATLHFDDGRPDQVVRIPERGARPRLLYQRQLALAHALHEDFEAAQAETGDGARSRNGSSYARHLGHTHPGCKSVVLSVRMHKIPDLQSVHDALESPRKARIDLDSGEYYSEPERIGEYPCAD